MALGLGLLAASGPAAPGQGFCPSHPGNPVLLTPGTATCSHDALSGDTTITLNAASIIEWSELDVPTGSVLDFNFLATAANPSVVNRITGTRTNTINGSLLSNGRVILLSTGSRIALNGFIQTRDFLASTMDVDDVNALLNGREVSFGGSTGSSTRLSVGGTVEADDGDVVLAGSTVSIGGTVLAPMGAVRTVSATQFNLSNRGAERILPGGDPTSGGTVNSGRIEAGVLEMKATREISNAGFIEAGGGAGRLFMRVGPDGKVINEGTGQLNGLLNITGTFDPIGVEIDPDDLDGAASVKSATSRFPGIREPGEKKRSKPTVRIDTGTVAASVSSSRDRNRRNTSNSAVARRGLHSKSGFFGARGSSKKTSR